MTLSQWCYRTLWFYFWDNPQDMTNSWLAHQKKRRSLKPSGVCSDAQLKSLFGFVSFYLIWTIAGCQKQCRSCYRTSDNISRTCHNLSALWLRRGSKITETYWVPWHRKRLISKAKHLLDVTDRDMSVKSGEKAMRKGSGDFEVEATQSEPIIQCLCGL